jgi:hypothetical protein
MTHAPALSSFGGGSLRTFDVRVISLPKNFHHRDIGANPAESGRIRAEQKRSRLLTQRLSVTKKGQ